MKQKENTVSLLTPPGSAPHYKTLSEAAVHDLGLDYLCAQITDKKQEQTLLLSVLSKMTDDPAVTQYRSDVFADIYQNEAMCDEILRVLDQIDFLRDYGSIGRTHDEAKGVWELMHRLDDLGRLGEECRQFREIYADSTQNSLLLLNETFSTTSFEEGYFIAKDAVRAILDKGIRTIYNTHMHKLAFDLEELNRSYDSVRAVSLIVKADGGKRSFQIEIAPPEGMSYAGDIARKYGVTYEMLVGHS